MKKLILILVIMLLTIFMLAGCGGGADPAAPEKPADSAAQETPADSQEPTVADKFAELKLVKELEQKNIKLVEVYNEVAALTVKNGWDKDEQTLKDVSVVRTAIQIFNSIIEDPASAKDYDLPEMLAATDELIEELDTVFRARVSVPYAK